MGDRIAGNPHLGSGLVLLNFSCTKIGISWEKILTLR